MGLGMTCAAGRSEPARAHDTFARWLARPHVSQYGLTSTPLRPGKSAARPTADALAVEGEGLGRWRSRHEAS